MAEQVFARKRDDVATAYAERAKHYQDTGYVIVKDDDPIPEGVLPVVNANERPVLAEGERLVYRMDYQSDRIVKTYLALPADAPIPEDVKIRRFSKLKLYVALLKAGLWERLVEYLGTVSIEIEGVEVNALVAYNQANELADNHPLFAGMLERVKTALGVPDDVVEAILNGCLV